MGQFRRAFMRNDKPICLVSLQFIAHLINQGVAHELLGLEILMVLLEQPTDDSVDLAASFTKNVGSYLQDLAPKGLHAVYERFRGILRKGTIKKKTQFTIEGLFSIRRIGFDETGHPARLKNLDLIVEEDQITHEISLDEDIDPEIGLDVFTYDNRYDEKESEYNNFKKEILGSTEKNPNDNNAEEKSKKTEQKDIKKENLTTNIYDNTETNLMNLRRVIYLTIMTSADFEEAGHKLLKLVLKPSQEIELVIMIIECCAQERTYVSYFGFLAQRFCYLSQTYQKLFEQCFEKQCALADRLETNKLCNVSKLFAHLLSTDSISWEVLRCIRLTIDDMSSSGRIYVKILFQEMSDNIGLKKIYARILDPTCSHWFENIFPRDSAANIRFSINFHIDRSWRAN